MIFVHPTIVIPNMANTLPCFFLNIIVLLCETESLAATLNEIVHGRDFGIALDEEKIPLSPGTQSACELLGLDPLYLANEGKAVVIVARDDAGKVLAAMRRHRFGRRSAIIGGVDTCQKGRVCLTTSIGGRRIVDMPSGDQLPRIC